MLDSSAVNRPQPPRPSPFRDARYNVELDEGFEFFRHYKGTDYFAKATGGSLLLTNTGQLYPSLNELSRAIGTWENAWGGWFFLDEKGQRKPLDTLRDQSKVRRRRGGSTVTLEELGL
jgi:hypothetical protein